MFDTTRWGIAVWAIVSALAVAAAGCGGKEKEREADYHTSGSRAADARAEKHVAGGDTRDTSEDSADKRDGKGEDRKRTLYERLGGQEAIAAVVSDFVDRSVADPRVNFSRQGVDRGSRWDMGLGKDPKPWQATPQNLALVKRRVVEFVSTATGGPSNYSGRDMKSVHAGMRITNAEFDAMVGDLKASLDKFNVPNQEQKELLAIVETTRPQIVEKR